jgi:hypothetical protein
MINFWSKNNPNLKKLWRNAKAKHNIAGLVRTRHNTEIVQQVEEEDIYLLLL